MVMPFPQAIFQPERRLRVTGEQPAGIDRNLNGRIGRSRSDFYRRAHSRGRSRSCHAGRRAARRRLRHFIEPIRDLVNSFGGAAAIWLKARKSSRRVSEINPVIAGLLASQGFAEIEVGGAVSAAVISTGDEVMPPGSTLRAGANLRKQLDPARGNAATAGSNGRIRWCILRMIPQNFAKRSTRPLSNDVLIISGGVSVGERDFVQEVLRIAGAEIDIWRVAIKPGKPFLFGRLKNCFVFGLPGNPVSAFVTFLMLVRPAILKLMGASAEASRASADSLRARGGCY